MRAKLNRENAEDAAVRNVPAMPNILENGRPNLRKLGQLPALLIKLGRIEEFFNEVSLTVSAYNRFHILLHKFIEKTWSVEWVSNSYIQFILITFDLTAVTVIYSEWYVCSQYLTQYKIAPSF